MSCRAIEREREPYRKSAWQTFCRPGIRSADIRPLPRRPLHRPGCAFRSGPEVRDHLGGRQHGDGNRHQILHPAGRWLWRMSAQSGAAWQATSTTASAASPVRRVGKARIFNPRSQPTHPRPSEVRAPPGPEAGSAIKVGCLLRSRGRDGCFRGGEQRAPTYHFGRERMGKQGRNPGCKAKGTRNGKEHDLPLVRQGRRGGRPLLRRDLSRQRGGRRAPRARRLSRPARRATC